MKRGRGVRGDDKTLTGGTGDVNTKWLILNPTLTSGSSAGSVVTSATPLPVQRLPQQQNSALILEALKFEAYMPSITLSAAGTAFVSAALTTNASATDFGSVGGSSYSGIGLGLFQDPKTLASITVQSEAIGTTISGLSVNQQIFSKDLTDQDGHGVLIATDQIYLAGVCSVAVAGPISARILYRWKEVPLVAYIGIVQSQQ